MAIDFNKFTTKKTPTISKPKSSGIDFNKFVTKPVEQPIAETKIVKFPLSLGGGSFSQGAPGELITTKRSTGAIEAPGQYREHIFPVSLGGTSPDPGEQDTIDDNINVYSKEQGKEKSDFENRVIREYKAGKIGLNDARAKILQKYRQVTGQDPSTNYRDYLSNTMLKVVDFFTKTDKTITNITDKFNEKIAAIDKKTIENTSLKDKRKKLEQYYNKRFMQGIVSDFEPQNKNEVKKLTDEQIEETYARVYLSQSAERNQIAKELIQSELSATGRIPGEISKATKAFKRTGEEAIETTGKVAKVAEKVAEPKVITNIAKQEKKIDFEKFTKPAVKEIPTEGKSKIEQVKELEIKSKSEKLGNPVLQVADNNVAIKLPKNLTVEQRAKIYDEVATIKDFDKQPIHISQERILNTPAGKKLQVMTLSKATQEYPEVKNLVDKLGLEIVGGKVQQPIVYKPIKEIEAPVLKTGDKTAGIAKSIEAKAIERGLITDGFNDLASFESTTMKAQSEAVADMIKTDLDKTRSIIRGEQPLPEGVNGISVIKGMEEIVKKTNDPDLAYELANSPLATKVSEAAQELSLTRGRTPDSATAKIQQIKKAREAKAGKAVEKKTEIKKSIKKETEKVNLSKEDLSWDKFLNEIVC